ncbi:hypothetical protein FFLO_01355 [Filobasidium floriforme]|uniref:Uncharacterized protein n=1 Tax=Filobasidium floriforme TaxID=5210 RepID=A0A8K0JRI4_9TREE|nr:hypothetical protein FFLO_01355 [Filobasidium floriforme]
MAPKFSPSQLTAVDSTSKPSRHVCLYGRAILGNLADLKPSTTTTADIDRLRKKAEHVIQSVEKDLDIKLQSDAFAFIRFGREAQAQEMPGLIFCARGDSAAANKDRAAAEIARLLALQDFTRFGQGLKCVQVYSPGGYFGKLTVELAGTEITPAARTAVAEKVATMAGLGTPTHILHKVQDDGKQIFHVEYRISDSDDVTATEDSCRKRLQAAATRLKQGLRGECTAVWPHPHRRNVHWCGPKELLKKGGTWDQGETFVRKYGAKSQPSSGPSAAPSPSAGPSSRPSSRPTAAPSAGPSSQPSAAPSAGPSSRPSASRPSAAPTVTTTMGFGSLAVTVTEGKGKGKKQGRAREISENSQVKELVPRKKRNLPEPEIRPAVSEQPAAGPAIEPVATLERLDAELEDVQRRRKAALEDLLRVQEAEAAKTRERLNGL